MPTKAEAESQVKRRKFSVSAQTKKYWGSEYHKPDVAYEFSSGKRYVSTDREESGIYRRS